MARQRLTAATIVSSKKLATAEMSVSLAHRLLGRGASDQELTTVARRLNASLKEAGVQEVYASVSRYAAEMGENFGGDLEDDGQPDPSDTQALVKEHETTPDVAVSDVAHHEKSPTTTISSKAKGTKKVACGTGCGGGATTATPEATPKAATTETPKTAATEPTPKAAATETPKTAATEDTTTEASAESEEVVADTAAPEEVVAMEYAEGDTDLEDPKDLEEKDDFLDDEIVDEMDEDDELEDDFGDEESFGDEDEDELGDEDDEFDDEFDDMDEDDDFEGDDDDLDEEDAFGDDEELGDDFDDEEGDVDDMGLDELESLADLGVDGVMVNKAAGKNSKNKKAGKKEAPFRPSRTRVASSGGSRDEMDDLFGVPDVGDAFDR
jgi:hypothetical protein